MDINYSEFKPSAALQPFVDCYWMQTFAGVAGELSPVQRCLPLGMMEIIVHLDDNLCEINLNDKWVKLPRIFVAGMYRDSVIWRSGPDARKFGIRLKPETFPVLFETPASVVFSNYTHFENIIGKVAQELGDKMIDAKEVNAVIMVAEKFLLHQVRESTGHNNYTMEAARLIRATHGRLSVDEVSRKVYVSIRQLQRSFQDKLGTSPKTYQRIIRFRTACESLDQHRDFGGWAALSYELGYADQAHFIREFKEFTGSIPNHLVGKLNQLQKLQH